MQFWCNQSVDAMMQRTQSRESIVFPVEDPSGDFEHEGFHSGAGDEGCVENCCGLADIPEEQVSDCECVITSGAVSSSSVFHTKPVPRENVHIRRIRTYRKKISSYLESISDLIGNISEPDGIEELKRRHQRAAEFVLWVSRNYHYVLQKQILNIKKQTKRPCVGARNTFFNAISQKLVTAHQITSQALQAYKHHLPSTVGTGVSEKLRDLLKLLVELSHVTVKLGIIENDGLHPEDIIEGKSRFLLTKLKSKREYNIETPGTAHTSDSQITTCKRIIKKNVKIDLTMYEPKQQSMKPKVRCWKKSLAAPTRTKVGPGPSSKTKLTLSQPISSKSSLMQISSEDSKKFRGTSRADLNALPKLQRRTRKKSVGTVASSLDNIETMMDHIPADDSEVEECTEKEKHSISRTINPVKGGAENIQTIDIASINQIRDIVRQLEEILPKQNRNTLQQSFANDLQNKMSARKQKKIKKSIKRSSKSQGEIGSDTSNVKLVIVEHDSSDDNRPGSLDNEKNAKESSNHVLQSNSQRKCKSSTLSLPARDVHDPEAEKESIHCEMFITNEEENPFVPSFDPESKDAIIVSVSPSSHCEYERQKQKDETSNIQLDSESRQSQEAKPQLDRNTGELDQRDDVESNLLTGVEKLHKLKRNDNGACIKPPALILTVPDEARKSLLDYHGMYHNYTSTRVMYKKEKEPWLITERMADQLVHDILKNLVTREIGMENLAKTLLQLEFK